jgi:DNA invertase Pin-like site-specific DNA recombinase
MKRIAVYIRVSTKDQTPDLQINDLLSYCQRKGWAASNVCVYLDLGQSGTKAQRPALKQLLEDIHKRKVDIVLVWKLDRLFRSLKHLVNTLNDWAGQGIEFISHQDNIDLSTASGRLMMQIMGSFAEFEASLIRERCVAGQRAARLRGRLPGRKRSFTPEQVKSMLALRERGMTFKDIGNSLGVRDTTVMRTLRGLK